MMRRRKRNSACKEVFFQDADILVCTGAHQEPQSSFAWYPLSSSGVGEQRVQITGGMLYRMFRPCPALLPLGRPENTLLFCRVCRYLPYRRGLIGANVFSDYITSKKNGQECEWGWNYSSRKRYFKHVLKTERTLLCAYSE